MKPIHSSPPPLNQYSYKIEEGNGDIGKVREKID